MGESGAGSASESPPAAGVLPARRTGTLLVLFVLAAGFVSRALLDTLDGRNLRPRPDALEYALGARRLATQGRYTIEIEGVDYPPRYPPGFPLFAAPFVRLRSGDPTAAVSASQFAGAVAAAFVAAAGLSAGGAVGALAASAVWLLSPLALDLSRLALSETAQAFLLAAALWLALRSLRGGGAAPLLAAGILVGWAASMRITNFAFAPALLSVALVRTGGSGRFRRAAAACAGPLLALAGLLVRNTLVFGHPLHDGYRFWVPEIYADPQVLLSPRYLLRGVPGYWERGHLFVYGAEILGRGQLWSVPAVLAAAIGILLAVRRRAPEDRALLSFLLAGAAPILAFLLLYCWQDPRFLVPLLPLFAVAAGRGAAGLLAPLRRPLPRATAAAVLLAVVAAPDVSRLGDRPWRPRRDPRPPPLLERLPQAASTLPEDALVLVNFPLAMARLALPKRRLVLTDFAGADPLANRIVHRSLPGLDGRTPRLRALADGGRVREEDLAFVTAWIEEGRSVFFAAAAGEAPAGPGLARLRERFAFRETASFPPITLWRIERGR